MSWLRGFGFGLFFIANFVFCDWVLAAVGSEIQLPGSVPQEIQNQKGIKKLCQEIKVFYQKQKWGKLDHCEDIPFRVFGWSVEGRPLVSFEVGPLQSAKKTLIQCAIHGDELPALPMCLRLIDEIRSGSKPMPKEMRIFIQPLLNPDGLLARVPTRTNSRGVDLNRNFPTLDWKDKAHSAWSLKENKNPRKFPGVSPLTEPETQAIVSFIETEKPQKIISIHTPLGFLDLDTKGKDANPDKKRRAQFLAINMSKNSGNFKYKSFGFYPGSLGNYAGNERDIPVYTLELPPGTTTKKTIDRHWEKFRIALWRSVDFDLETGQFLDED
jgi:protein MpaA